MKTNLIIAGIIFLIWTGLSMIAGDYLDWFEKEPKPITPKDSVVTVVTKTDTITRTITKFVKGKVDTVFIDSSLQYQTYSEIIDSTITFDKDSLNFVAEIVFNDSSKSFDNFFDFSLRLNKIIRDVVRYVEVPTELEVYQEPLVVFLMVLASFLFGLTL